MNISTPISDSRPAVTSAVRLYTAIALLLAELFFLSLLVDAHTISRSGIIGSILSQAGDVLRWSIVFAGILALYFTKTKGWSRNRISDDRSATRIIAVLILHLLFFVGLVVVTALLFKANNDISVRQSALWLTLVLLVAFSWCLIIVDVNRWRIFIAQEKLTFLVIGICALIILLVGQYFQQFWQTLNVFTLSGTRLILGFFYHDIYFDPGAKTLGLPDFKVIVDSACSGIEGIIVAVSTTGIYLFLSRDQLRFPQALTLLPIACVFSILLNLVRISSLIVIGAEFSPRIAVEGFHSVAGWLAAVLVALIIVFIFSSWKWIQRPESASVNTSSATDDHDLAVAILTPFAVFVGLTLASRIFFSDFEYLYPLKITITAMVLGVFWKRYQFRLPENPVAITVAGVSVAILWIALAGNSSDQDAAILDGVQSMPAIFAGLWVVFRVVSFWIVVPIFEELVFRSYLISRFSGQSMDHQKTQTFHWWALVASSLLFGLIHDAWLAGFIAGIIYALLRFRSEKISSCIFAHGLSNFLITGWAIYTGQWSLI